MKLLGSLFFLAAATLGADAAPCTSSQLATVDAITNDPALKQACPTVAGPDMFASVAPCSNAGCLGYLYAQVDGRLPDCEVDDNASFKDLFSAFISVCKDNAPLLTNTTIATNSTTVPPTNATSNTNGTTVSANATNSTTTPTPTTLTALPVDLANSTGSNSTSGNATSAPDPNAVGGSTKPAVPAPAPSSLATRQVLAGIGATVIGVVSVAVLA